MPKARSGGSRAGSGKKARGVRKRGEPMAKEARPVTRRGRVVAPKRGSRAEETQAGKALAAPTTRVVPEAVSAAVEKRKEGHMAEAKQLTPGEFLATVLVPQYSRDSGHICWDCKHFKPVLKGSKFPPTDTVGWCTMIHWPFYWCVTDFNVVKKCYAFEKGVYSTKKF